MSWEPENLFHTDTATWTYTNEDRHFWPPDGMVPDNAKLIVDVGCNAGLTTGIFAETWAEAQIIGIEMNAQTAYRAKENVASFGDRIKIIVAAAGWPEREEVAVFTTSPAVDHFKIYEWLEGEEEIVQVKSLDNILKEADVEGQKIDLMKIDIEAAEWEVINDGGNWTNLTSTIVLEPHSNNMGGDKFEDVIRSLGFDVTRNPHGQIVGHKNIP